MFWSGPHLSIVRDLRPEHPLGLVWRLVAQHVLRLICTQSVVVQLLVQIGCGLCTGVEALGLAGARTKD